MFCLSAAGTWSAPGLYAVAIKKIIYDGAGGLANYIFPDRERVATMSKTQLLWIETSSLRFSIILGLVNTNLHGYLP